LLDPEARYQPNKDLTVVQRVNPVVDEAINRLPSDFEIIDMLEGPIGTNRDASKFAALLSLVIEQVAQY
jgi:hypothetical protein